MLDQTITKSLSGQMNATVSEKYFNVSVYRVFFLSVFTLGLYSIFWFYKNWEYIKQNTNKNLSPFWRSIFSVFFCNGLFDIINKESFVVGCKKKPSHALLAAIYIIPTILGGIMSRADTSQYGSNEIFYINVDILFLLIVSFIPLIFIQRSINCINKKNNIDFEKKFTISEVILIIIGLSLFLSFIYNFIF